jgi:aminoglycoside 3-N-acetyltransferase
MWFVGFRPTFPSQGRPQLVTGWELSRQKYGPDGRFMQSRQQLANDIRKLGIEAGNTVMLHASVRAVGEIAGGPDQIHLALKDVLTAEGTLIMYASCPRYYDEVGRGNLTKEQEAEILEKLPAFDPLTARSARDNGTLVEFFRTYPDSRVSRHVARFVVWGKQADYLISDQPWNYAFGLHSPLDRFLGLDGKILLLGSDHDAVTFLHYVEHVAEIPGKRISRFQVPVLDEGRRVWRDMEEFDTSDGVHANWPDRFFAKIVDAYLAATGNQGGRVGSALSYVARARGLLDFASPIMESVAIGPRGPDDSTKRDAHH